MVGTISIKIKGLPEVIKYFSGLSRKMPKASKESTEEIARDTAKLARKNLGRHTKMSNRLRRLIHSTKAKKAGPLGWNASVIAEQEAVFWELGVRPHWVSFFNPKTPSWIGTPRKKFRDWARTMGLSDLEMRAQQSMIVSIPRTEFMRKAHNQMSKRAGGIVSKNIKKILK